MVENKPLARALYAEVDVGEMVPMAYWEAISMILAQIRRLDEQRRRVDGIGA
jgi:flagellar biosynthetic protein FlhB